MAANGDIYKDGYAGWYSVRDEAYYDEEETELRADGVRCGPQGTPVEWVEEESYFFRLSAYQDRLLALYESQPDFIGPAERRNEVMSFVKSGLKDLSISRTTFDWGVPVPGDEKHVMYVWVDALTNYITAAGYPGRERRALALLAGRRPYHRQGHRALPCRLLAGLPDVGGHRAAEARLRATASCSTAARRCRSRSATSSIRSRWSTHYGLDQVRYFLLREVPFGQDGNYSHEAIVNRTNADLANDLGNLAQRSLSMIAKNCGGLVPARGKLAEADKAILQPGSRRAGDGAQGDGASRRSTRRWRRSSAWWPRPTAISPARSPGR